MDGTKVYGPSDGLYYISGGPKYIRSLWNPSINEVRTLPRLVGKLDAPPNTIPLSIVSFGFGLDPLTGDYKVVVIRYYQSMTYELHIYPSSILVYSLSNDSWKYCGDLDPKYILEYSKCYVFVNGCCFWLGGSYVDGVNSEEIIISFDMTSNSSQEILFLDCQRYTRNTLGMYQDFLAFFSVNLDEECMVIWTLYNGTWTKTSNIDPIPNVNYFVGQSKNNKVLLLCTDGKRHYYASDEKLVLCDPNTQEIKDLEFKICTCYHGVFAYMESLVSVKAKIKPALGK